MCSKALQPKWSISLKFLSIVRTIKWCNILFNSPKSNCEYWRQMGPGPPGEPMTNLWYNMRINVYALFFRVKLSFGITLVNLLNSLQTILYFNYLDVELNFARVMNCRLVALIVDLFSRSQRAIPHARWHPYDGYHNPCIDMMWWHMSWSRVLKCPFKNPGTLSVDENRSIRSYFVTDKVYFWCIRYSGWFLLPGKVPYGQFTMYFLFVYEDQYLFWTSRAESICFVINFISFVFIYVTFRQNV